MLQEVQTIRRWDGLEPVAGATGDWSGGEAVELDEESGGGERRGSRGMVVLKAADEESRDPQTKGPETAGFVAELKDEAGVEDEEEEDEDEEEGWRLVSKGIEECESRAEAVRSMGGEEGGRGPKVTRGLRVTEVVIGRRDGGRGEAERAAAVGREEELEEEGGEMERGADSWVESTEGDSEEGGRAKDTMEGGSDGDAARGATTESVALVLRGR
jgi:hypothetical protein